MKRQLDLFIAEPETPLVGLRVKLDCPAHRDQPCCRNFCTLTSRKGSHAAELLCVDCGQHRGWLSNTTAHWLENVIEPFGAPTTPVIVRKSTNYEEEALTVKN